MGLGDLKPPNKEIRQRYLMLGFFMKEKLFI
jgi:hypothetical protein